ncbi:MAG: hypothetical protein AAF202_00090 [Pseudomonadota bacterium]
MSFLRLPAIVCGLLIGLLLSLFGPICHSWAEAGAFEQSRTVTVKFEKSIAEEGVSYELSTEGHIDPNGELLKDRRFKITIPSARASSLFEVLFKGFGLMYMIAPSLPVEVQTNFSVRQEVQSFILDMYQHEQHTIRNYASPRFALTREQDNWPTAGSWSTSGQRAVVLHSGGKDSAEAIFAAAERVGAGDIHKGIEAVTTIHFDGLNHPNSAGEARAAREQARVMGLENAHFLPVTNSSGNTGHGIIRARDFFLLAMATSFAVDEGADRIWTEGEQENDSPFFGGTEKAFEKFNRTLTALNVPVMATWTNMASEVDVVSSLLKYQRDTGISVLPQVFSCFSPEIYARQYRRNWTERTRILGEKMLAVTQGNCGSCVKCRLTNLVYLIEDLLPELTLSAQADEDLAATLKTDLEYVLQNLVNWQVRSKGKYSDFLDSRFFEMQLELMIAVRNLEGKVPRRAISLLPENLADRFENSQGLCQSEIVK